TGAQRAERVCDRARRGVVTGESGGLVDEEAVLARADLGADGSDAALGDLVGELRGGRVAGDALVPDGARVGEALRALVGGDLGDGGGPVVEKSHAATVTIRGLTAHPAASQRETHRHTLQQSGAGGGVMPRTAPMRRLWPAPWPLPPRGSSAGGWPRGRSADAG